jgi:hypothetical protein
LSNSGNGQTYTADALFSVSLNNTNIWSETYDDVMQSNINIENGGTLYLKVAPYFSGGTGTYLLDVQITRIQTTGIDNIEFNNQISIYPNPTSGQLTIECRDGACPVSTEEYIIYSIMGQVIMRGALPCRDTMHCVSTINVESLANGMYYLKIADRVIKFVKE